MTSFFSSNPVHQDILETIVFIRRNPVSVSLNDDVIRGQERLDVFRGVPKLPYFRTRKRDLRKIPSKIQTNQTFRVPFKSKFAISTTNP